MGPAPVEIGGVAGMAGLVLGGLVDLGHEIDCYVARLESPLPKRLEEHAAFSLIDGESAFRYDAWYSRTELTKLASGQLTRAFAERRLERAIVAGHRIRPYDLVYQFSHIEILGRRGQDAPPFLVHPETHAAGELRWFRRERALARICEPLHRRAASRAILSGRAAVQRRHARVPIGFVCPSRSFQQALCTDYGIDPDRTRVVPNPVDLTRFRPAPDGAEPRAPLKILFVSRISVRKGVETVVELSHRLADLAGGITIEIVGTRTQWSDYTRLLLDLNRSVATYRGGVPAEAIPEILASADVLIQPSKYEPFGLTVAEALASGVPVVATDAVGAVEGVSRECVRVVGTDDIPALEREIRSLVGEIQRGGSQKLARAARREAERLFAPAHVSQGLVSAFEELLA